MSLRGATYEKFYLAKTNISMTRRRSILADCIEFSIKTMMVVVSLIHCTTAVATAAAVVIAVATAVAVIAVATAVACAVTRYASSLKLLHAKS